MKNRERGRRKKIKEKTRSWAGFGPAHAFGAGLAHFKKKIKEKKYFSIFIISPCVLFYAVLFNLSLFFLSFLKNTNPVLKYLVFVKTSKNTKKNLKREKYFCAFGQVSQS